MNLVPAVSLTEKTKSLQLRKKEQEIIPKPSMLTISWRYNGGQAPRVLNEMNGWNEWKTLLWSVNGVKN